MSGPDHPEPAGAPQGPGPGGEYARIAAASDEDLAAELLALTPTHEGRDRDQLRAWARVALGFGRELADTAGAPAPGDPARPEAEVTDMATGGLRRDEVLLAEYLHRAAGDRVIVYADALDYARGVAEAAGWGGDYPRPALREAALAHEEAHRMLHRGHSRELRRRLDHTVLRWGPLRVRGHIVGADEIAAHAYAGRRGALRRSPLALTAAIAATLAHRGTDHHGPGPRTTPGDRP
ncbi:hypothetical protein Q8791_26230 [Nocardiopsis sp. CT-R113]|uniref:Uncharacterized protein n=1 Tax=Nocardiopsis codii TaxID=3065942 RepID=A0ABU7KGH7_9ACTN|nr:hypothetical protein [Nocardiopsis sp. CT-R113]MEE2040722.1 hypothetical protein [Nocardiopsis sp. CT-R113]